MKRHNGAGLTTAVVTTLMLISEPAAARRTVIDQGQFIEVGGSIDACTIGGAACSATLLPFMFDFGTGLTNEAYVYDRGIISFGDPLDGVDPSGDFTTFGIPVIAPLYVPGASGVDGPYEAFAATMGPGDFPETLPNFGSDLFVFSFLDPSAADPGSFLTPYIHLIMDASSTELRFEFIHGQSFLSNGNLQLALPDTAGTQLGYALGNQLVLNDPPNIDGVNAFTFRQTGEVPEPSTWAMMLFGFGGIGVAMRRRRSGTLMQQMT